MSRSDKGNSFSWLTSCVACLFPCPFGFIEHDDTEKLNSALNNPLVFVDRTEDGGMTLLYYAISRRAIGCAALLLRRGADPARAEVALNAQPNASLARLMLLYGWEPSEKLQNAPWFKDLDLKFTQSNLEQYMKEETQKLAKQGEDTVYKDQTHREVLQCYCAAVSKQPITAQPATVTC